MNETKEQIRTRWIRHTPHMKLDECVDNAMEEYSKSLSDYIIKANAQIEELLEKVKELEAENMWISVSEKLPIPENQMTDVWCLVYGPTIHISVHPYSSYHNCWDDEEGDDYFTDAIGGKITHWKPLPPQPPPVNSGKKEDENKPT